MNIKETTARRLLLALGYENADSYAPVMLAKRLKSVESNVPHDKRAGLKDPDLAMTLKAVCAAAKRGEAIEILAKTTKTLPLLTQRAEREMNEGLKAQEARRQAVVDMEAIDPDAKPKKPRKSYYVKKPPRPEEFVGFAPTVKKPHKPGTVLRTIFDAIKDASVDDPVSKDDVFEVVERKFPEKAKSSLMTSVNGFPHWLEIHYPYTLNVKNKRYWLTPKKKETVENGREDRKAEEVGSE